MTNRTQPLKILFDATPMLVERTGIGYYTERLVTQLAKQYPNNVELIGFYYNFLGRRDTSHLPQLDNLRYRRIIMPSKIVYELRRWGIEFPIELLSFMSSDFILYPNFLGYPSLSRTPSAPVIHDLTYLDLPEYVSAKLRRDLVRFVPKAIARSRFVITVSAFSKERIANTYGVPPENILVTPIPPMSHTPLAEEIQKSTLERLGLASKPYILFVGTVEPRKNIPALIEAYKQLPEGLQGAYSLVIAGRIGWNCQKEIDALQDASTGGYDVRHLGYVADQEKETLYQNARLFVSASQYEGFGMPVLEAMNYGVPCAISDIPVFKEVAGSAAVYFDYHRADAIATAIAHLLQNPEETARLGAAGKQHASSYNWQTVATALYQRIDASVR